MDTTSPNITPSISPVPILNTGNGNGGSNNSPRACLVCRPNSHPFEDRNLALEQPVKVGRSVARARPSASNAIFDCKVLSRNHALLWYETGKFYLQDTKSSNGTFVNGQRLSKGSEESMPREVCSGDILQFGVDVMENSRKVTHGCIVATLKLYLPDGKEAKASPTIVTIASSLPTQDLYQLNQYIQEALVREQLLETKLAVLQRLVGQTECASNDAWKSLIDEDRLLTRVEILESQLSTYGKGMNEEKLREEVKRLMEEKESYQETAKETLKRLVDEKLEAVKKLQDVEKALSTTEDEVTALKELYERDIEENKKLAQEVNRLNAELEEQQELARKNAEEKEKEEEEEQEEEESNANRTAGEGQVEEPEEGIIKTQEATSVQEASEDTDDNEKVYEAQLKDLRRSCDELRETNSTVNEDLMCAQQRLCEALELLNKKDRQIDELMEAKQNVDSSHDLRKEVEGLKLENERLAADVTLHLETIEDYEGQIQSASTSTLVKSTTNNLEQSLMEAEDKITELLKVKEKYAELASEKASLANSLSEKEEEMNVLSLQTRTATACALVPLVVIVLAVCMAYLPYFSTLFGTADKV